MLRKAAALFRVAPKNLPLYHIRNASDTPVTQDDNVIPFETSSHVSGIIATVFGATGFSGRYVVSRLGDQGSQVVVPYRGTENTFRHLKVLGDLGQIVPMACDVWKPEQIEEACAQSNLVINLIGSRWATKNFSLDDTNHKISANIARAAKKVGVSRMIHVSALGASENSPSEFAKTKFLGECAVREEFPEATILRPSTLFGFEDTLLTRWAGILRFWPVVPLISGTLERKEAPISATDFAKAVQRCIFDLRSVGKVYELEGPKPLTNKDLIDLVRRTTYLDTREMEIPFNVMKTLATVTGSVFRKPRFTADELEFYKIDNLATPGMPGFADLNIHDVQDINEIAVKFIRHFRRAKFVNEL